MTAHSGRAHSLLSPSSAGRWINCTPSAQMCEACPEQGSSPAAMEGTLAHEMAEYALSKYLSGEYDPMLDALPISEEHTSNPLYTIDMPDYVAEYCEFVIDAHLATFGNGTLELEKRYSVSKYVPDACGTSDAVIQSESTLHIIDLKYGKGVRVDAKNNSQLMLYALGAILSLKAAQVKKLREVKMSIAQVRLGAFDTYTTTPVELLNWAKDVVKPAAEKAIKGEGVCKVGDWCKFCSAKVLCRAQADEIAGTFEAHPEPLMLCDADILDIIPKLDTYISWCTAVKEHVLGEALKGKKWEGYKVVAGRGRRKWIDEESAKKTLEVLDFVEDDYITKSFKGIGDIEKLVGKKDFPQYFSKEVTKVMGAPTLVPDTDKREALDVFADEAKVDDFN